MKFLKPIMILLIALMFSNVMAQDKNICFGDGCNDSQEVTPTDIASYLPEITPLYVDDDVIYDRDYRQTEGAFNVFDTPNGNIIRSYSDGFSYVTINNTIPGWVEIAPGEWIQEQVLNPDVLISRFAGVLLPDDPLEFTAAWTLRHLRASETPGGEESPNNPFMYRYTRVNIYSTVEVDGYNWYQIGENEWVHQFNVAKILPVERPEEVDTEKWISVDLYEQVIIAYEGTKPVFASLVSSGLADWPTNEGLFHVYLSFERTTMAGAFAQPDFYRLEEVPYTMYFDGDIALHGTYWHDGFGYRQSHGCVNLSITDAKWLFDWAQDQFDWTSENPRGAAVFVYSSGVYDS